MTDFRRADDPETADGPDGPRQYARLAAGLSAVMRAWAESNPWFPASPERIGPSVRRFLHVYGGRPIADNASGSRFNACVWLYVLTRLLGPRLVIESGTHRGQSAWLFRVAARRARIVTFDISHEALQYRAPDVDYRLEDWSKAALPPVMPAEALGFFDDHVDQARRVREAWERGFRWLIFDDNIPAHALFATGRPPAPTISMLYDTSLRDGEEVTWTRHGRPRSLRIDRAACDAARRLIAGWSILPDLHAVTGFRPQLGLTVVRLVDRT